jgi:hypothetical protein
MAKNLMSLRAYAAHRGCALQAVQKAIQSGRIKKDKSGKIDAGTADIDWAKSTDPSKQRNTAPASTSADSFAKARAAREAYNAKLAQLNYEERSSGLVDAAMVRRRAFENARAVRDVLLNIPNRISGELAGQNDPQKIHNMLTVEITRALDELTAKKEEKTASEQSAPALTQTQSAPEAK